MQCDLYKAFTGSTVKNIRQMTVRPGEIDYRRRMGGLESCRGTLGYTHTAEETSGPK